MNLKLAIDSYTTAEHLLGITFSQLQETKIFLAVLQHLHDALQEFPGNKASTLAAEIQQILSLQQQCTTQFQRGKSLVLCQGEYELTIINLSLLRNYVQQVGELIGLIRRKE